MGTGGSGRADAANLAKVDHVVVVMLENRSFDHMLGYLSLTGSRPEIDGLRPGLANEHQGRTYPVYHLAATALEMDPDHSSVAVDRQVADGGMNGFVASAAATLAADGTEDGDPGCVMVYYDGTDVPVYDHLAGEFAVCDRWFASVPGATLPNRLYALCGVAAGSRDDRPLLLRFCPQALHEPQPAKAGRGSRAGLGPQYPGMRVAKASHLGELLTRTTPRPAPPRDALLQQAAARAAQAGTGDPGTGRRGPSDRPLNDLQQRILAATHELRRRGHPLDTP